MRAKKAGQLSLLSRLVLDAVRLDGVGDSLFHGQLSVLVHLGLVLGLMGQASRAADTAADAGHTFNEILRQGVFGGFEQRHAAGFDPSQETAFKVN